MTVPRNLSPPSMPLAPPEYTRVTQDQYSNVIRLHFNQQDTAINQIIETLGSAVTLQWLGDLS